LKTEKFEEGSYRPLSSAQNISLRTNVVSEGGSFSVVLVIEEFPLSTRA